MPLLYRLTFHVFNKAHLGKRFSNMKMKLERKTIGGALKVDIFQSIKTAHSEEKLFD